MLTHLIQENDYGDWDNYIFFKKNILVLRQKHKQSSWGSIWDSTRRGHCNIPRLAYFVTASRAEISSIEITGAIV